MKKSLIGVFTDLFAPRAGQYAPPVFRIQTIPDLDDPLGVDFNVHRLSLGCLLKADES
jgi:hypothetical protein